MITGRIYSCTFSGVSVSAAQDLFEINAPSDAVVVIMEVHISQDASETSEQLPFQIHMASTSGSGGSTVTARPLQKGYAAYGGTIEANNTTRGTAGNVLRRRSENVLNGVHWLLTPEEFVYISPSDRAMIGLETAPAAALTMSGECIIVEVGG